MSDATDVTCVSSFASTFLTSAIPCIPDIARRPVASTIAANIPSNRENPCSSLHRAKPCVRIVFNLDDVMDKELAVELDLPTSSLSQLGYSSQNIGSRTHDRRRASAPRCPHSFVFLVMRRSP